MIYNLLIGAYGGDEVYYYKHYKDSTDSSWCSLTPTYFPSNMPSLIPSLIPTNNPTNIPSNIPSNIPTIYPTKFPTYIPSNIPSLPTNQPTMEPTCAEQDTNKGEMHVNEGGNGDEGGLEGGNEREFDDVSIGNQNDELYGGDTNVNKTDYQQPKTFE